MIYLVFRPYRLMVPFIGCQHYCCTLLLAESDEGKGTAEGATGSQSHVALVVECLILCALRV